MADYSHYYTISYETTHHILSTYVSFRSSLFTGFLTLSSFLISATTFIILQMKKEVYEHKDYINRVVAKSLRSNDKDYIAPTYRPLQRLSSLFTWVVGVALTASLSQITIGLIPSLWAVAWCYLICLIAFVLVIILMFLLASNLRLWFEDLESEARPKVEAAIQKHRNTPRPGQ